MLKTFTAIVVVVALVACQKDPLQDAEQKGTEQLQKITVSYTVQPQSTLVHLAVAKGYFREEGLDVTPKIHTYGKAALKTVIDHEADFATVAETPFMFNVLKGEKIFALANIEASNANNAVVARKDAGIAAVTDLKGKRVAFTPGTTSDFFLDSLLTANGLLRQDIHPVELKPEEMLAAIVAKRVDAVSTWNYPLIEIRQQLGDNGEIFYDREIYTETFNIAAQQDFVRKNPETVKRFLRALLKAENFAARNPNEAQAIVATATKTDIGLVRAVWNDFGYRVMLDQTLILTLEDETRWAMKNKLAEQAEMPDFRNYIDLDSLKAVKPEAVKINH